MECFILELRKSIIIITSNTTKNGAIKKAWVRLSTRAGARFYHAKPKSSIIEELRLKKELLFKMFN